MHIAQEREDNVSGVIIGGDSVAWQVWYNGRPQSSKLYADTSEEAEEKARAYIDKLKRGFCGHPCYLYGDESLWEIRVWGA